MAEKEKATTFARSFACVESLFTVQLRGKRLFKELHAEPVHIK
jgi:hypothetical protein